MYGDVGSLPRCQATIVGRFLRGDSLRTMCHPGLSSAPPSFHLCNQETYDYLRSICSDVTVVQGDVDERAWPDTRVVTLGDLRVGLCHGHQVVPAGDRDAVAMLQREMDADVLVLGGSHAFEAYKHEGRFVINPGSATGAFHPLLKDPVPGFVLLDIDGTKV